MRLPRERIAVIGGGIAGLGTAWTLDGAHEVHLFERASYVGGHTHTSTVAADDGRKLEVDTGFIVYNETTYPLLSRLFAELEVETQPTNMSFSLRCERCDTVYSGLGLTGVFADPRNALRTEFLRFLLDIDAFHRFGRSAPAQSPHVSLEAYLRESEHGDDLGRHYALPLASALWSTGIPDIRRFPLQTFIDFFRRHRLFQIRGRLAWRTVTGGSRRYVSALLERVGATVRRDSPVLGVRREPGAVRLELEGGAGDVFDRVVVATHADDALALLADPTSEERELLGTWRYARSDTWLHSDSSVLADSPKAHASWNYHLRDCRDPAEGPTMTYNLNRLQRLDTDQPFLVTLNPASPPDRVHTRRAYRHPIFTPESVATQGPLAALGDDTRTYFCGAHLGFGFHEDGLRSGVRVGERLGGRFA